jgi:5-methyltetrahydrofolate--homocysteine methyltransferase
MPDLKLRLAQPGILVADGAMGTMLQSLGLPPGRAPERWNLENPQAVQQVQQRYIDAGAQVILTNTFGGSRLRLQREGLEGQVRAVNLAAARLARAAAGPSAFVLGDLGPTGQFLKPLGPLSLAEAQAAFAEQAAALAEGGVDGLVIETFSDLNEAKAAIAGAQPTGLPILVTMSFDTHGRTMMGVKPAAAAQALWALGVAAVGANCGRTLSETLTAIQAMRQAVPEAVLMAKPNAGLPHAAEAGAVYDVTPQVLAEYALQFAAQGVKVLGACCGSTPEHIRAIAQTLEKGV